MLMKLVTALLLVGVIPSARSQFNTGGFIDGYCNRNFTSGSFEGNCYQMIPAEFNTHNKAKQECAAIGGYALALPRSAEENKYIFDTFAHALAVPVGLGFKSEAGILSSRSLSPEYGTETCVYSNWAPNEPDYVCEYTLDNPSGVDKVVMSPMDGLWHDSSASCSNKLDVRYLCWRPMEGMDLMACDGSSPSATGNEAGTTTAESGTDAPKESYTTENGVNVWNNAETTTTGRNVVFGANCNSNFTSGHLEGNCYQMIPAEFNTPNKAKKECAAIGGYSLALPRSAEENKYIFDTFAHVLAVPVGLGLRSEVTQLFSEPLSPEYEEETCVYSNWAPNEPNHVCEFTLDNPSSVDKVVMSPVDGLWSDMSGICCNKAKVRYLCWRPMDGMDLMACDGSGPRATGNQAGTTTPGGSGAETTTTVGGSGAETTTTVGGSGAETTTTAGGSGAETTTTAGGSGAETTTTAGGSGAETTTTAGGSGAETTTTAGGSGAETTTTAGGSGAETTTTVGGSGAETTTTAGGSGAETTTTVGGYGAETTTTAGGSGAETTTTAGGSGAETTTTAGGSGAETTTTVGGSGAETTTTADPTVASNTTGDGSSGDGSSDNDNKLVIPLAVLGSLAVVVAGLGCTLCRMIKRRSTGKRRSTEKRRRSNGNE